MHKNPNKKTEHNLNIISASEIGQYQYCPISWKLQRSGYKPNSIYLEKGEKNHIKQGKIIKKIDKINKKSKILNLIGYFLTLIAIIIIILEVIM